MFPSIEVSSCKTAWRAWRHVMKGGDQEAYADFVCSDDRLAGLTAK